MGFGDIMKGLAHGGASLLGLGSLYDPMAKLRGQLAQDVTQMNNMVANESLESVQVLSKNVKNLYRFMGTQQNTMKAQIKLNNEMVWDSLNETNLFIAVMMISIIIIIFYILIKKKCC